MPAAEGLAELAASVESDIARVGESSSAENIHELRVNIARLSAALRIPGRRHLGVRRRSLRRELRWLRHRLAPARDWDIFAAHRSILDTAESAADPLLAAAARERMVGQDRIALAVRSGRCLALVGQLRRLERPASAASGAAPLSDLPSTAEAAQLLQRQLRRILKDSSHLARLRGGTRHKLRARVRRLRYSAEYLSPLFGSDSLACLKALAALQKTLGRYNDSRVVQDMVKAVAPPCEAARAQAIAAHHHAEAGLLDHRLNKEFAALRRLTPFWAAGDAATESIAPDES